jgi:hypothetical protein
MFRAAEVVGPQTRALLVFYGLSQAGRAIAAAAVDLKGESWNLISHGIRTSGFDKDFADIEVRTDPAGSAGSFVRLSELLQSPVWGNDTVARLADVWNTLPVNLQYPLTDRERFTPLYASGQTGTGPHPMLTIHMGDIPDRIVDDDGGQAALDKFLMSYPGTLGYHSFDYTTVRGRDVPRYERHNPDAGWLYMHWEMLEETASAAQLQQRLRALTRAYAGHRYFFPAVAGLPRELHPLMAWWVILYALSMLARYLLRSGRATSMWTAVGMRCRSRRSWSGPWSICRC